LIALSASSLDNTAVSDLNSKNEGVPVGAVDEVEAVSVCLLVYCQIDSRNLSEDRKEVLQQPNLSIDEAESI